LVPQQQVQYLFLPLVFEMHHVYYPDYPGHLDHVPTGD
jgi:hypothetical protein